MVVERCCLHCKPEEMEAQMSTNDALLGWIVRDQLEDGPVDKESAPKA